MREFYLQYACDFGLRAVYLLSPKFKIMKNIIFAFLLLLSTISFSQVGIGTTTPDASSVLDITATDAGLLVPRLTTTQRDALSSPATGLLIFNTTTKSFQYNFGDGSSVNWYSLDAQSDTSNSSSISGLVAANTGALIVGGSGTIKCSATSGNSQDPTNAFPAKTCCEVNG